MDQPLRSGESAAFENWRGQAIPNETAVQYGAELESSLGRVLGDEILDEELTGGPFGREMQFQFARAILGPAMLDSVTLPEIVSRGEKLWDLCRPWTEGLSRLFDAVQEELIFQHGELGPEAQRAEAAVADLPILQRLAHKHLSTGASAHKKRLGDASWLALLRDLPARKVKLEEQLEGNAKKGSNILGTHVAKRCLYYS